MIATMEERIHHLFEEVKKLPLREVRFGMSSYLEFVLYYEHISSLKALLEKYFGPPITPESCSEWEEVCAFMLSYGGVRKNQTLYFLRQDKVVYYAMIWPWGDKASSTVRIEKIALS